MERKYYPNQKAKPRGSINNNNTKHTDDNKEETDEEIENNASPKNNNLTERQKQVELEFRVSATATKLKKYSLRSLTLEMHLILEKKYLKLLMMTEVALLHGGICKSVK